ncbi:hypothetical protein [Streptomyces sp. NPDC046805]|uniref:MmyB family transcriptional regulator n=1 Tax=Streptomyces sp. NPDC046805 TaxID=3155134 RepID=UPI0033DDA305
MPVRWPEPARQTVGMLRLYASHHPRDPRLLVLVGQLSRRWGTRYTSDGKLNLGRTAHDTQTMRPSLGSGGSRRRWIEVP